MGKHEGQKHEMENCSKRGRPHTAIDGIPMTAEHFGVIHEPHQSRRWQQPVIGCPDCRGSAGAPTEAPPDLPQQKCSGNRCTAIGPPHGMGRLRRGTQLPLSCM